MTLHKSTQTIEQTYTVEGPNDKGKYRVTHPNGFQGDWWAGENRFGAWGSGANEAVARHIASLPKPPTISDTWYALIAAKEVVGGVGYPDRELTHNHTPLTEDEAITLTDLLKKIKKGEA